MSETTLENILASFRDQRAEAVEELLANVPAEGGNVTREILERLVEAAYDSGVIDAITPAGPGA